MKLSDNELKKIEEIRKRSQENTKEIKKLIEELQKELGIKAA